MTGQVLVDRGVLPRETDALAHCLRVAGDVEPEHLGAAGIGPQDRGEDAHGGGLARAVGTKQPEDGAGRDREVDPVEGDDRTEPLSQIFDDDGVRHAPEPLTYA